MSVPTKPLPIDVARLLGSEVVAIAVASALAYMIALRYDRGFLSYYHVPGEAATLTKSGVFTSLGGLFVPVALIAIMADWEGARSVRSWFLFGGGAFLVCFPAIIYWGDIHILVSCLGALVFLAALPLVLFIWRGKNARPIAARFLRSITESTTLVAVVVGVALVVVAPIYGYGAASARRDYLVLTHHPRYALVRISEGRLIAAEFKGNKLTGRLLIEPVDTDVGLVTHAIGPLHYATP